MLRGGREPIAMQDDRQQSSHRDQSDSLRRTWPVGADTEWHEVRFSRRALLPALGAKRVRLGVPRLVILGIVETDHGVPANGDPVELEIRDRDAMSYAEQRMQPEALVDHAIVERPIVR